MNFSKILIYCFLISIIICTFASSAEALPESDHDYANNFDYTWPAISEPGATQMRLHFAKLDLASDLVYGDKSILLNKEGNQLKTYTHYDTKEDFWTEWYTGDTLKVKLTTNGYNTAYGFKIDKMETRPEKPNTSTDLSISSTAGNAPLTEKPTDKTHIPSADFSASQTSGNAPLTVAFTDESSGFPTAWKWNFGDGSDVLIAYNPTHTYLKPGIYTVKETVSNVAGKTTQIKTNYITVTSP